MRVAFCDTKIPRQNIIFSQNYKLEPAYYMRVIIWEDVKMQNKKAIIVFVIVSLMLIGLLSGKEVNFNLNFYEGDETGALNPR